VLFAGYGLYCGLSDEIPYFYNKGLPAGSGIIGLLLTKEGMNKGAYEMYALNLSNRRENELNNAVVIKDQSLWIPLGLAVAESPPPPPPFLYNKI
jgi:hypothetical protein